MHIYSSSLQVLYMIKEHTADVQSLILTAIHLQLPLQVLPLRCIKYPVIRTHTHTHMSLLVACKTCGMKMTLVLV